MSKSRLSHLTGAWIASRKGQLHVYKLHWSIPPGALRNYFGKFGQVDSVHIPYAMDTGLSKGFGFVRMVDNEVVPKILDQKYHRIGDFNFLVSSTIQWRKRMSFKRGSRQESSVDSPLNLTPDLGPHDPSNDNVTVNSSSVDPPVSGNYETTPTDRKTPPTIDDIHSTINSSSSVDPLGQTHSVSDYTRSV